MEISNAKIMSKIEAIESNFNDKIELFQKKIWYQSDVKIQDLENKMS